MVKEIVVLRETGIPLFHYSVDGTRKLDEIVSAFLSAIGSLVGQTGNQQIREMTFAESKFVWESKGDLLFIALVSREDSAEIYRAILHDLSEQFVSMFYSQLRMEDPGHKVFRTFTDTVEMTLQKFDGIPGLARRYRTALLPLEELRRLKMGLAEAEGTDMLLRGAAITEDGYILVSNLRSYELEAIIDLKPTLPERELNTNMCLMVVHTSLDPVTSFFVRKVPRVGLCAFVVKAGRTNEEYMAATDRFVHLLETTDLAHAKKVEPAGQTESTVFYDYDVIIPLMPVTEALEVARSVLSAVDKNAYANALALLNQIDGKKTFLEILERTGIRRDAGSEALALLIARGVAKVAQLYPMLGERDRRFAAYLEVIGIPKKDFAVVDTIWQYCTGELSLREISQKTGIATSRVLEVLRELGANVKWETDRFVTYTGTTRR
ncbi:MAG: hypothetical protein HXY34_06345 [Candidatus Thorarchaeota archaeon]|nr:hypothetical protein [Candidatus Thorarchaeota archaeon]